jgi:hypothetical protein
MPIGKTIVSGTTPPSRFSACAVWCRLYSKQIRSAFFNTPGIQHAANYTGKVIKPDPPVYDPALLAQAMFRVAQRPRSGTYVGGASLPLKLAHELFPSFTSRTTAAIIRNYLNITEPVGGRIDQRTSYGAVADAKDKERVTPCSARSAACPPFQHRPK